MTRIQEQPESLDDSFPLEPMRLSSLGEQVESFKSFLSNLVSSHPTKLTSDQVHKLRDTYRLILLNVICNSQLRCYTAISRASNAYIKGSYWSRCGLSYRFTKQALDRLIADGYIVQWTGYFDPGTGLGKLTRIFGLPKLTEVVEVDSIASSTEIPWEDQSPLKLTGFPITPDELTADHPEFVKLHAVNSFLKHHQWPFKAPMTLIYKNTPVDGGRVYTRFQNMPRAKRMELMIDGQPTVELDYKANHLSMLLAMQGKASTGDPYMVIADDSGCNRDQVKQFITAGLGSDSETKAFNALKQYKFNRPLFNRIKESCLHCFPGDYLFKGIGTALQSVEGQIALDIMYQGSRVGIPVLPVHDSFITTSDHEHWLLEQMKYQWSVHTNDLNLLPKADKKK